jgi:hypothetical protein
MTITNKFDITAGSTVAVIGAPDDLLERIRQIPDIVVETHLNGLFDTIILFLRTQAEVESYFVPATRALRSKAFIWTLFPSPQSPEVGGGLDYDRGWAMIIRMDYRQSSRNSISAHWEGIRWEQPTGKFGRGS